MLSGLCQPGCEETCIIAKIRLLDNLLMKTHYLKKIKTTFCGNRLHKLSTVGVIYKANVKNKIGMYDLRFTILCLVQNTRAIKSEVRRKLKKMKNYLHTVNSSK